MQRLHCPRPSHNDRTPSVVVYEHHAYCFGGCGRIELSELEGVVVSRKPAPPEDLAARLDYINRLPRARVRGLDLPVDGDSYYIAWPSGDYYKQRKFIPGDGPKYKCPRGHKKPLFIPLIQPGRKTLAVVEGELNALSLASLNPPFNVCSPGGVGDFNEKILDRYASFFFTHTRFKVLIDKDPPGVEAAIRMKKLLLRHTPFVDVVLMPRDCNDLLLEGRLHEEVKKWT